MEDLAIWLWSGPLAVGACMARLARSKGTSRICPIGAAASVYYKRPRPPALRPRARAGGVRGLFLSRRPRCSRGLPPSVPNLPGTPSRSLPQACGGRRAWDSGPLPRPELLARAGAAMQLTRHLARAAAGAVPRRRVVKVQVVELSGLPPELMAVRLEVLKRGRLLLERSQSFVRGGASCTQGDFHGNSFISVNDDMYRLQGHASGALQRTATSQQPSTRSTRHRELSRTRYK